MAIPNAGLPKCVQCGRKAEPNKTEQEDKIEFTKCIKCGRVLCNNCWQPEYWEICPNCSTGGCG